jgi:transcriptional regulator with XRE-family HTH domain
MPVKLLQAATVPTEVIDRLAMWGRAIRTMRVQRGIAAVDLCRRIGVSRATLNRLENGDPSAGVAGYLGALLVLGMFDEAVPELDSTLWSFKETGRVRMARPREQAGDDDYF